MNLCLIHCNVVLHRVCVPILLDCCCSLFQVMKKLLSDEEFVMKEIKRLRKMMDDSSLAQVAGHPHGNGWVPSIVVSVPRTPHADLDISPPVLLLTCALHLKEGTTGSKLRPCLVVSG